MRFFGGAGDPAGTERPAADLEPTEELIFDEPKSGERAVVPLTEGQRRSRDQLATLQIR